MPFLRSIYPPDQSLIGSPIGAKINGPERRPAPSPPGPASAPPPRPHLSPGSPQRRALTLCQTEHGAGRHVAAVHPWVDARQRVRGEPPRHGNARAVLALGRRVAHRAPGVAPAATVSDTVASTVRTAVAVAVAVGRCSCGSGCGRGGLRCKAVTVARNVIVQWRGRQRKVEGMEQAG